VETELAVSVSGGLQATIDPYLYGTTIVVHPQSSAEQAIEALDEEIQRLQETAPKDSEVARAVKQARALFAYGNERITNQAFWLGFSEMFAGYDWFTSYLDNLATVTPEDVQRVAKTYLRPQNRTLGIYLPHDDQGDSA
jgi:zinc protease